VRLPGFAVGVLSFAVILAGGVVFPAGFAAFTADSAVLKNFSSLRSCGGKIIFPALKDFSIPFHKV
jgi:hypothetical protein